MLDTHIRRRINESSTSKGHMRRLEVLIRGHLVSEPGLEGLPHSVENMVSMGTDLGPAPRVGRVGRTRVNTRWELWRDADASLLGTVRIGCTRCARIPRALQLCFEPRVQARSRTQSTQESCSTVGQHPARDGSLLGLCVGVSPR